MPEIIAQCGAKSYPVENQKHPQVVNPGTGCDHCRYTLQNGVYVLVSHNPDRRCVLTPAPTGTITKLT